MITLQNDNHLHIYNELDVVQTTLANAVDRETYERRYSNSKTKNVKIDVSTVYDGKGIGAHSVDYYHPEVIQKNIDNGTIPKF